MPVHDSEVILCNRMISTYVNALAKAGFVIEKMIEQSQVGQEVPVQILTPGQASLSKLKDVYRQVLYLKHKDKETLLDLKRRLEPVLEKHPMFAGITIQFDFDPLSHY